MILGRFGKDFEVVNLYTAMNRISLAPLHTKHGKIVILTDTRLQGVRVEAEFINKGIVLRVLDIGCENSSEDQILELLRQMRVLTAPFKMTAYKIRTRKIIDWKVKMWEWSWQNPISDLIRCVKSMVMGGVEAEFEYRKFSEYVDVATFELVERELSEY